MTTSNLPDVNPSHKRAKITSCKISQISTSTLMRNGRILMSVLMLMRTAWLLRKVRMHSPTSVLLHIVERSSRPRLNLLPTSWPTTPKKNCTVVPSKTALKPTTVPKCSKATYASVTQSSGYSLATGSKALPNNRCLHWVINNGHQIPSNS